MNTPLSSRRFNSGPRLQSQSNGRHQGGTKNEPMVPGHNTGKMLLRCAWCDTEMGSRPCAADQDGLTSHGICRTCVDRQMEITPESFAPVEGAGSCAVSSATAGRDRHSSFDVGQGAEPSRGAPAEPRTAATPGQQCLTAAARSTASAAAAGVEFVSVLVLAEACGLSSYRLDMQFRPAHWASPRELRWDGRELLYAVAAVPELREALALAGLYDAALKLEAWMARRRPAGVEPWYKRGAMA